MDGWIDRKMEKLHRALLPHSYTSRVTEYTTVVFDELYVGREKKALFKQSNILRILDCSELWHDARTEPGINSPLSLLGGSWTSL
tara:strand:+ start:635 stop:889 length:255 start_codon:yes stop_codon:yes gene_type:complete